MEIDKNKIDEVALEVITAQVRRGYEWDMTGENMDHLLIITVGYIAGVCGLADDLKRAAE